jgi:epoxyqueuosine reductase
MDKSTLISKINEFVQTSPLNRLGDISYYDEPLIGFAAADNPIFQQFREPHIVGPMFKSPTEWLPTAKTVIAFFMPSSLEVRQSNHPRGIASDQWMHARFKGDSFINDLRRYIIIELKKAGALAVAPHLEPTFAADFNIYTSNWSERHIAYAAGLGTFSLNKGLITAKGMAGRFGSVVTDLALEPTPITAHTPFENCPHAREGKCGACIKRCPVGAITADGKNKYLCHQYIFMTNPRKDLADIYAYPYSSCGKCQTKVPCEHKIP